MQLRNSAEAKYAQLYTIQLCPKHVPRSKQKTIYTL